ncbi:MAG: DUF1501 domain-containing protein [Gemmataceae bacterium]|nr:DUF1501 domain-containing protein [Gemmataceae bacterium]
MHPLCDRRGFFGLGGLALAAMLQEASGAAPPRKARAKSVIWLFMNGGVSHMESFDPKPALAKYAGKTIGETPYKSVQDPDKLKLARVVVVNDANGQQRNKLLAPQAGFKKRGKAGAEVSDWFPHIGEQSGDIAFVRSMYTTDDNHGAQTQFHSGRHMLDGEFPTLGAWVHYGLGTLNRNLPQFISMGGREYWNAKDGHYLGPQHDAVPLRIDPANPLDYGRSEAGRSAKEQEAGFGLVGRLNKLKAKEYPDDAALAARIKAYELAFRMQASVPDALKFDAESAETKKLYGIDQPATRAFGMQMLAARRLVEKGVRFIQVQHGAGGAGAWDAHGGLRANHANNAKQVDRPIAGLLADLKRRGLLDETIVLFATEFGRTPGTQGTDGRDHHIYGFSVWMAGGGTKGGVTHGATDELGFHATEDRHYVTDIHATILALLGLDSRKLEVPGRKRLDIDHGKPIRAIMA